MKVIELIINMLTLMKGQHNFLQIMIDDSVPKPFEDVYEVKLDKGFLLFKKKKEIRK